MVKLTGNTTQSLQAGELPDNDVAIDHGFGASSHGNGEHENQRHRKRTNSDGDSVDDYVTPSAELVGAKHNDGANDSKAKDVEEQPGQFSLKRGSDGNTQEAADDAPDDFKGVDDVGPESDFSVGIAMCGGSVSRRCRTKSRSNEADLGVHSSSKDDAASTALGDDGGAEGDIDSVTRTSLVFESHLRILSDG